MTHDDDTWLSGHWVDREQQELTGNGRNPRGACHRSKSRSFYHLHHHHHHPPSSPSPPSLSPPSLSPPSSSPSTRSQPPQQIEVIFLGDAFLIFKKNLIYLPISLVLLSDQMNFTKMAGIKSNINQNLWRHLVVKICIKSKSRHLRANDANNFQEVEGWLKICIIMNNEWMIIMIIIIYDND